MTQTEDEWMHPAIWVVLFFLAPPVWLLLICARFAGEILAAVLVVIMILTAATLVKVQAKRLQDMHSTHISHAQDA